MVLSLVLSFLPFSGTLFHLPSLSGSPGFPLLTGYRYAYSNLYSILLTCSKKLSHLLIPCHHQIYENVVHSYHLSSPSFPVAIWLLSPQLCRTLLLKDSNVFEVDFYQSSGFSSHSIAFFAPSVLTISPLDSQTQSSPGYLPISASGFPHHHFLLFFCLHEKDFP